VILRMKKEDSAYVYQVLESYEGITNYSTVDGDKGTHDRIGSPYRDVVLHIAPDLRHHVDKLVENLKKEIYLEVR
jgi:hypothetical protein